MWDGQGTWGTSIPHIEYRWSCVQVTLLWRQEQTLKGRRFTLQSLPAVGCSFTPASRGSMAISHDADNVTGSNAVDATAGSTSSPLSSARRHLNTWLAFTPLARATSATLAPGSSVNSTIWRFSAAERHRRTQRPELTSPTSTMSRSSAHRSLN